MDKFIIESAKCRTVNEFRDCARRYSTNEFNFGEGNYNETVQHCRYFNPNFPVENSPSRYYNRSKQEYYSNYVLFPINLNTAFYWFSLEDKTVYYGTGQLILSPNEEHTDFMEHNPAENYYYNEGKYYHIKYGQLKIEWKKTKRPTAFGVCLQPLNDILNYTEAMYGPWFTKWVINTIASTGTANLPFVVTHPELELLTKMTIDGNVGFPLAKHMIGGQSERDRGNYYRYYSATDSDRLAWNRNFKEGKNIKEITGLPSNVLKALWVNEQIAVWDTVRKMISLRGCTPDEAIRSIDRHYRPEQFAKIDEILRAKYDDKAVFSYTTLFNYLDRLNVNEAIDADCALDLIRDCLTMARQINEEPTFMERDSLKREHDLLMRRQNETRDARLDVAIQARYNDKYYFEDDHYLVRQIKSYDDLIDEGSQQHNCLRYAYSRAIANGTSLIYVMRKKEKPDVSLISIELDPAGTTIRQKYLAYNKQIDNKNQLTFLDKWNKFREKINAKEDASNDLSNL